MLRIPYISLPFLTKPFHGEEPSNAFLSSSLLLEEKVSAKQTDEVA